MAGNTIPGFKIAVNDYRSVSLFLGCKVAKCDKFSQDFNNICRFLAAEHYLFTPHIGEVFGVFIQDKKTWFRGKIKNYYNLGSGTTYEVFLIDIGNTARVTKEYLVPLNELMKQYKPQVLKFGIYGVVPNVAFPLPVLVLITCGYHSLPLFPQTGERKMVEYRVYETDQDIGKGVVKISDNFKEDIIQFCKVFERTEEVQDDSENVPNNNLENTGSVSFGQRLMYTDDGW
ncbi:hypothetical protein J6590_063922 [Homalodisca vitripennis]|nr:hypothetical protein J6590_063922 [Homalodisca vitripennis]